MQPAVFLDRDDTILNTSPVTRNDKVPGDLFEPGRAVLLPGAAQAIARLRHAGFTIIVYTSQGGVARGTGTLRDSEAVNDAMRALLEAETGELHLLTAVYYCPFHPKGSVPPFNREHTWRKPAPGMVTAAAAEFGLDIARSWAIGDKPRDCEAAVAAGIDPARAILIGSSGEKDARCPDLAAAARIVVS
jgi:histidinol-phosphate phosphatase family protein